MAQRQVELAGRGRRCFDAVIPAVWILWDSDNQTLHDKVAKTWVVNVEQGEVDPLQRSPPHARVAGAQTPAARAAV
jgi:uncharacterized RDD family membrane protein YckC